MNLNSAWLEILDASGLTDLACETHGHDLLDGIEKEAHGKPLDYVFRKLCRYHGVKQRHDIERVLVEIRTIEGFGNLRIPDEWMVDIIEENENGPKIGIADHTSRKRGTYSDSWGTPAEILDLIRVLYGPITHDLASNEQANRLVRAYRYWSVSDRCPLKPTLIPSAVVWCNPPGPGKQVKYFWQAWLHCIEQGASGGFLIFKQDHWRQLPPPPSPLPCVVLRKRLKFVGAPQAASFPSTLVLSPGELAKRDLIKPFGHLTVWEPW